MYRGHSVSEVIVMDLLCKVPKKDTVMAAIAPELTEVRSTQHTAVSFIREYQVFSQQ